MVDSPSAHDVVSCMSHRASGTYEEPHEEATSRDRARRGRRRRRPGSRLRPRRRSRRPGPAQRRGRHGRGPAGPTGPPLRHQPVRLGVVRLALRRADHQRPRHGRQVRRGGQRRRPGEVQAGGGHEHRAARRAHPLLGQPRRHREREVLDRRRVRLRRGQRRGAAAGPRRQRRPARVVAAQPGRRRSEPPGRHGRRPGPAHPGHRDDPAVQRRRALRLPPVLPARRAPARRGRHGLLARSRREPP